MTGLVWTRCVGGDCIEAALWRSVVLVQDSAHPERDPQAWTVEEWAWLVQCIQHNIVPPHVWFHPNFVELLPWRLPGDQAIVIDSAGWEKFCARVEAGEFDIDTLRRLGSESSSTAMVGDSERTVGTEGGPRPGIAAAGADSGPAPAAAPDRAGRLHRGRSFSGHEIEDRCPCPQEACGLVSTADPHCRDHGHANARTMRQIHRADRCPALGAGIAWTEDPTLGDIQPGPQTAQPGAAQPGNGQAPRSVSRRVVAEVCPTTPVRASATTTSDSPAGRDLSSAPEADAVATADRPGAGIGDLPGRVPAVPTGCGLDPSALIGQSRPTVLERVYAIALGQLVRGGLKSEVAQGIAVDLLEAGLLVDEPTADADELLRRAAAPLVPVDGGS